MARPAVLPELPREQLSYAPNLSAEFKRFREAFRLTQEEAAKKAGVSQRVLSRFENNRTANLDARTLISLGAVYGLSPNAVARMAGWWTPATSEQVANPKWDYVLHVLGNPDVSEQAKTRLIELCYASARAVESLDETGGMERYVS